MAPGQMFAVLILVGDPRMADLIVAALVEAVPDENKLEVLAVLSGDPYSMIAIPIGFPYFPST